MDIMDIAIAKALAGGGGGGGGASSFIVNVGVTFDEETSAFVIDSVDKTLSEVRTAYTNGSDIKARVTITDDPDVRILSLSSIDMSDGQDSTGAQFNVFIPTFENTAITEISGFHLSMFPSGNAFEFSFASFS